MQHEYFFKKKFLDKIKSFSYSGFFLFNAILKTLHIYSFILVLS